MFSFLQYNICHVLVFNLDDSSFILNIVLHIHPVSCFSTSTSCLCPFPVLFLCTAVYLLIIPCVFNLSFPFLCIPAYVRFHFLFCS